LFRHDFSFGEKNNLSLYLSFKITDESHLYVLRPMLVRASIMVSFEKKTKKL